MIPDEKELIENPLALTVHNKLRFYGIDETIIRNGELNGIRNAAIGTFRIVLHKAQQEYDQQERNRVRTLSFVMMIMTAEDNLNYIC